MWILISVLLLLFLMSKFLKGGDYSHLQTPEHLRNKKKKKKKTKATPIEFYFFVGFTPIVLILIWLFG